MVGSVAEMVIKRNELLEDLMSRYSVNGHDFSSADDNSVNSSEVGGDYSGSLGLLDDKFLSVKGNNEIISVIAYDGKNEYSRGNIVRNDYSSFDDSIVYNLNGDTILHWSGDDVSLFMDSGDFLHCTKFQYKHQIVDYIKYQVPKLKRMDFRMFKGNNSKSKVGGMCFNKNTIALLLGVKLLFSLAGGYVWYNYSDNPMIKKSVNTADEIIENVILN